MDTRFKWDMFITSFIPLWVSIIVADTWDLIEYIVVRWSCLQNPNFDFGASMNRFVKANFLLLFSICTISIVVTMSIAQINEFLRDKETEEEPPKGCLLNVSRANKLTAEFLLAYILPMIAFDFSEGKSVLLFVMYLGVLAYLCIRNNNVYTNIYLELKGYKMYECDVRCWVANSEETYMECLVLSQRDLVTRIGSDMRYYDFDNYIYVDLEKNY